MKIENRRKLVRLLLDKGHRSLEAAASLLREGFAESAISRAYYASFYLAQASLATKDVSRSKHSGVVAAFGEHLTKKSLLPADLHKTLLYLFEFRVTSDYSVEDVPSLQQAKEAIEAAKIFSKEVDDYLQKWLGEGSK